MAAIQCIVSLTLPCILFFSHLGKKKKTSKELVPKKGETPEPSLTSAIADQPQMNEGEEREEGKEDDEEKEVESVPKTVSTFIFLRAVQIFYYVCKLIP